MSLPCPACGFLTIGEECYGTYNICPICDWEDDPVQLANPACGGGANTQSLIEAQSIIMPEYPPTEMTVTGITRDSSWRPLSASECKVAEMEKQTKLWMNKAVYEPANVYWNEQ